MWVGRRRKYPAPSIPPRHIQACLAPDGARPAVSILEAGRYAFRILNLDERGTEDPLHLPV